MSAVRASFFATRGASSTPYHATRGGDQAASKSDAWVRRGRRDVLLGISLGTFCPSSSAADSTTASVPDAPRRPVVCSTGNSCVSTSSFRTPANYEPPWEYIEADDVAFKRLSDLLADLALPDSLRVDAPNGKLSADIQYDDGVDSYEFWFKNDGSRVVLFSAVSDTNKVSPPGCFTPGCINGPRNRKRVEDLRKDIGWLAFETDEDKKWVSLLLH